MEKIDFEHLIFKIISSRNVLKRNKAQNGFIESFFLDMRNEDV